MSKTEPARWVLPAIVNPPDRMCVQIMVPREKQHIAAFRGALLALASAYKWSDDIDRTAKDVAIVWRDVIDNIVICDEIEGDCCVVDWEDGLMETRQEGCKFQAKCIDGSWATLFDATDCINEAIREAASLSPQGAPDEGDAKTACLTLPAIGRLISPIAVSPGDTVTITDAHGAWYGDGITFHWYCPDGNQFALGLCLGEIVGPGFAAPSGHPMPGTLRMRLIAKYGDLYFDAYNTSFDIPSDAPAADLEFLANDDDVTDNAGSVTFCAEIFHPVPIVDPGPDFSEFDWLIDVRLNTEDYDWLVYTAGANGNMPRGFVSGVGVTSGASGNEVNWRWNLTVAGGHSEVRKIVVDGRTLNINTAGAGTRQFRVTTDDNISNQDKQDATIFESSDVDTGEVTFASGEVQVNSSHVTNLNMILKDLRDGNVDTRNVIAERVRIAGTGVVPNLAHV